MSTALVALPQSSDSGTWTPDEKAIVEAAGLVHTDAQTGVKTLADRPVVAAFLQHCTRTGLDPIARQIYSIARKSKGQLKWQIQISIDGARLVAERSGRYEGQTTPEFTADGTTWTQVWLSSEHPAAARVGIYRRGFREPLYAVALWDAYVQTRDEWVSGRKTGNIVVGEMWLKMGPLMLAKCAEMLALRKTFPMELSGLYSTEEMQQAETVVVTEHAEPSRPSEPASPSQHAITVEATPSQDWAAIADGAQDYEELKAVFRGAEGAGDLGKPVEPGSDITIDQYLREIKAQMLAAVRESADATEPVTSWPVVQIPNGGDEGGDSEGDVAAP